MATTKSPAFPAGTVDTMSPPRKEGGFLTELLVHCGLQGVFIVGYGINAA